jgi:hypothetical protein
MNGVTRVLISVLLLGVCAVAMRFTMFRVDVLQAKTQIFTGRIQVGKIQEIQLKADMTDIQNIISVNAGLDGVISGSYHGSQADNLKLSSKIQDGALQTFFKTGQAYYDSFILSRKPLGIGVTNLLLPPKIPLFVEMFSNSDESTKIDIDLQKLMIKEFKLTNYQTAKTVNLSMPVMDAESKIEIQNELGETNIWMSKATRGKLRLENSNGRTILYIKKNLPVRFKIFGNDNAEAGFQRRVQKTGSFAQKQFEYLDGSVLDFSQLEDRKWLSFNPQETRHELDISIELGKTGTLQINELEEQK